MLRNSAPVLTHLARMAASCLAHESAWDLAEQLGAMTARQRAAADIHDGAAQNLIRLQMLLDGLLGRTPDVTAVLPELLTASELVTSTIHDLRAMISSLRDPDDHACQPQELAEILDGAVRGAGIPDGMVSVHRERGCRVSHPIAVQVRQIVTEALINAGRHADATAVSVRFSRDRQEAVVRVTDNGHGFSDHARDIVPRPSGQPDGSHVGTDVMRLRAAAIGGRVEIRTAAGGTEVVLRWPLEPV